MIVEKPRPLLILEGVPRKYRFMKLIRLWWLDDRGRGRYLNVLELDNWWVTADVKVSYGVRPSGRQIVYINRESDTPVGIPVPWYNPEALQAILAGGG